MKALILSTDESLKALVWIGVPQDIIDNIKDTVINVEQSDLSHFYKFKLNGISWEIPKKCCELRD